MLLQDIFINRKEELRIIPNGIKLGQNFVLIAPRRYGKTTLIKKIIERLPDDIIPVYIDIMRYSYSLVALTEAIVDGCLAHIGFSGKLRNWSGNINLKLDNKFKIQE
ncbi:MAG: ATP-binding protein [Burkholderiales bacterium]|nr:ATP-binding protein [Burkholderiales bacterium]